MATALAAKRTDGPAVSIGIPVLNASRWLAEALESALSQTYSDLEILVVDNASTDGTLELARSYTDDRVRVFTASKTISAIANHNRTVRLARGDYLKFLHGDDRLLPDCVAEMTRLAERDSQIGLVFAQREIRLEGDAAADRAWAEHYGRIHERIGDLAPVNDGRTLFRRLLAQEFSENLIGEPSSVLIRREALERVGLMNERLHQIGDLDLWARIMLSYKIGYVDRALAVYRHHGASVTAENAGTGRDWLDRLWLFESLAADPAAHSDREAVLRLRQKALRRALRAQARRLARGNVAPDLVGYGAYRLQAAVGRRPILHEPLTGRRDSVTISADRQPASG
jgi:glycosyltransferase involved in cell wall biosynthesis